MLGANNRCDFGIERLEMIRGEVIIESSAVVINLIEKHALWPSRIGADIEAVTARLMCQAVIGLLAFAAIGSWGYSQRQANRTRDIRQVAQ